METRSLDPDNVKPVCVRPPNILIGDCAYAVPSRTPNSKPLLENELQPIGNISSPFRLPGKESRFNQAALLSRHALGIVRVRIAVWRDAYDFGDYLPSEPVVADVLLKEGVAVTGFST